MGLTEKMQRFAEHYVTGETAGNATESVLRAGYGCKDRESAGALGAQLLRKPDVAEYIATLRAQRQVSFVQRMRPWQELVPEAQALEREAIALARKKVAELSDDGRKPSSAEAGLIRAGLEAAELVQAYGLGKPIHRIEQGEPGDFYERDLNEMLAEVREYVLVLRELGIDVTGDPTNGEQLTLPPALGEDAAVRDQ